MRLSTILFCISLIACADTDGGTGLDPTELMDVGLADSCLEGEICPQYDGSIDSSLSDRGLPDFDELDVEGLDAERFDVQASQDMTVFRDAELDTGTPDGTVLQAVSYTHLTLPTKRIV